MRIISLIGFENHPNAENDVDNKVVNNKTTNKSQNFGGYAKISIEDSKADSSNS